MDQGEQEKADKAEIQHADLANELAIERTALAANRTLMGWIRTGASLIGFAFAIYNFLLAFALDPQAGDLIARRGRHIGLLLLALGTISVIMGIEQNYQTLKRLNRLSEKHYRIFNAAFVLAAVVSLLGAFLFVTILIHREIF